MCEHSGEEKVSVHIISKKRLKEYAKSHASAKPGLEAWTRLAQVAQWTSLAEVHDVWASADLGEAYPGLQTRLGACVRFGVVLEPFLADDMHAGLLFSWMFAHCEHFVKRNDGRAAPGERAISA